VSEIRLDKIRKEFKDLVAVKDVTITFPTSTVTCLLGPSGCGKTTLMRIIAGLETPTSGDVYFDDERVTEMAPRRRNIGMVFQYPVVYRGISARRNIELPLLEEKLSSAERNRRIDSVIETLGLQASVNKRIDELDNGTRQKVAVARAVARQPRIVLFDEPITNVDVAAKVQLKQALKALTRQHQQTIVYVTHDQTEAMTLADQIMLMKDGEIVQRDTPRALYNQPNNTFGGWFLGNPGMNFLEHDIEGSGDTARLSSPIFAAPVRVSGLNGERRVSLGIRPEHIRVSAQPGPGLVQAQVVRKSVVVGGQYLLTLQIGEQRLKAKIEPALGQGIGEQAWVDLPLDRVSLFTPDGPRLEAKLSALAG
jgi:ABC-type sugar transport system ATPase subunit